MSVDSRHVDLTMTSESESDGHPADEMIISKAAKRAAAKRQAADVPDADAAAADQSQQQPKKKRKKNSPPQNAGAAASHALAADARSPAGAQPQRTASPAGVAAPSAKPRKVGAANMLSPDNAQQLRQRSQPAATPAMPAGAAAAAEPPPGLETVETVRSDPQDAAVLRTPAPLGVIVVEDDGMAAPNSEVQRLLRAPR